MVFKACSWLSAQGLYLLVFILADLVASGPHGPVPWKHFFIVDIEVLGATQNRGRARDRT